MKLAQSVCSPSPLQVQMLGGMFDVASEGNNAGCQVGKSQAREAARQSGKLVPAQGTTSIKYLQSCF